MKPLTLLLAGSLAAHAALATFWVTHRPAGDAPRTAAPTSPNPAAEASLRAALQAGDAKALAAAGVPADRIRDLQLGRQLALLAAQRPAEAARPGSESRWWRKSPGAPAGSRQGELQRRRAALDALRDAMGDDLGLGSGGDAGPLAYLSPAKREGLRRILEDYEEMTAQFGSQGILLAADRERLRLLEAERERDLAALLTPAEKLQYELRTSPTAAMVRARYGDGLETEDQFRQVYALQKAFDEKFPTEALSGRPSPDLLQARAAAQRQLQDDLRAALGEQAYANLRRATDPDLRTLEGLASRLGLPAGTTDRIAATRESLAAESQRINQDTSVPFPERRAQVQALAQRARTELTQTLGAEAAEAYAPRSMWLNLLQAGMAYATTPQAGTMGTDLGAIHPVLPAGAGQTGMTRQVVISGNPGERAGDGTVRENVQVMTFSTSTTRSGPPAGDAPGADPAGTTRRVIIAQPPPNP